MQVVIGPKQSLYPLGAVRVYEGLKMSIRTLRPREVRINPSCYADLVFAPDDGNLVRCTERSLLVKGLVCRVYGVWIRQDRSVPKEKGFVLVF